MEKILGQKINYQIINSHIKTNMIDDCVLTKKSNKRNHTPNKKAVNKIKF